MKNILLLLAALLPASASAQTVRGIVREALTRDPLPGTAILETGTVNGTTAGQDGRFELRLTGAGQQLTARFVGYRIETIPIPASGDLNIFLYPETMLSEEVLVQATRADSRMPMTVTNVDRVELDRQNLGRDLPFLVQYAPSVVQTSDAGTGIGYTGLRIRGVDPTRINVTINGVPVNDSESQNVFWVNTPDLASSTGNIQLQRGVGTSTNGTAAFGATMNVESAAARPEAYGTVTSGAGAFGTLRYNLMAGTGNRNGLNLEGRYSQTRSDGFIDRASAELSGYSFQATRFAKNSLTKFIAFGGKEVTYQAWYGTPEARVNGDTAAMRAFADRNGLTAAQRENLLRAGRSYNFYDYENQVDNYRQHHLQLHHSRNLSDSLVWNGALHFTRGKGFFEEFVPDADLQTYFQSPVPARANAARRRWLDNHFAGFVTGAAWRNGALQLVGGGGFNTYNGLHLGEGQPINGTPDLPKRRYYENSARKTDANAYLKASYALSPSLSAYADIQGRTLYYRFFGFNADSLPAYQNTTLNFLNPKAGLVFTPDANTRYYASLARGSREPGREEFINSTPQSRPNAEFLNNLEAGVERRFSRAAFQMNLYAMEYRNQLTLTGQVNDVGAYIRRNVPHSYRRGIELMGSLSLSRPLVWSTSVTASRNRIRRFTEFLDAYDDSFNPLPQQTAVYRNTNIAFSPELIVNNSVRYTQRGFSAELLTKYVSRQYLDNRTDLNNSLPAYTATDLLLSYTTRNLPGGRSATLSAQLINVFNSLYSSNGYTFGYAVGNTTIREDFLYPQAGRHGFLQLQFQF